MKTAIKNQPLEKTKFKWKQALGLIALGLLAYIILRAVLSLGLKYDWIVWFVYEGIGGLAVLIYVVIVRGDLSSKPPTVDMLPNDWTVERKEKYVALALERRRRGKKLLYIALPFIIAVMLGIVSEIWWPLVSGS